MFRNELCLFAGHISSYLSADGIYLVDGTAINGVSGGPVFGADIQGNVMVLGLVSAYIPNIATGQPEPGLSIMTDISPMHDEVKNSKEFIELLMKIMDEKAKEDAQALPPGEAIEPEDEIEEDVAPPGEITDAKDDTLKGASPS